MFENKNLIIVVVPLSTVITRSKFVEKNATMEGNVAETLDAKVSDMFIVFFAASPLKKNSS